MEEEESAAEAGTDTTGGPGGVYQLFVIMEELLDKLKLLHYESSFCRQLGHKPFSRYLITYNRVLLDFFQKIWSLILHTVQY